MHSVSAVVGDPHYYHPQCVCDKTSNVEHALSCPFHDGQCAFFDVRVFNPFTHTYRNLPLTTCYRRNEQEKRRAYNQRVREIEHGCFSPVFLSIRWNGPNCQSRLQEAGINDRNKTQPMVQPNAQLAPL